MASSAKILKELGWSPKYRELAAIVETAWKWVMPILDTWASERVFNLPEYQGGTWGPIEADRLMQADGRQWRTL